MKVTHKEMNIRRKKHLEEGVNLVWHGISHRHFLEVLDTSEMKAYTTQRHWADGKTRKDDQPDYETSYWMHGWSFSRSKEISMNFGDILLEIDFNEVKKQFPYRQISWNYTIGRNHKPNHKKEQEEFVIAHKGNLSYTQKKKEQEENEVKIDELYELMHKSPKGGEERKLIQYQIDELSKVYDTNWYKEIMGGPKGKPLKTEKVIKGFYLRVDDSIETIDFLKKSEKHQVLINHPQFLGFYNPKDFEATKEIKPQQSKKISP